MVCGNDQEENMTRVVGDGLGGACFKGRTKKRDFVCRSDGTLKAPPTATLLAPLEISLKLPQASSDQRN